MKNILGVVAASLLSTHAFAIYNANLSGVITHVTTYADTDSIYIVLNNQPTSHTGSCNPVSFVIDSSVPLERRKMMLARALAAHATGETINIGFDSTGNCADGYIRAHRVG